MQFHTLLAPIFARTMSRIARCGFINGLPGFISAEQDHTMQATALQVEDG